MGAAKALKGVVMRKDHLVVIKNENGNLDYFPLKQWLRDHPMEFPTGMNTDYTSYQLRRGLKKKGWALHEDENRVLLVQPVDGEFPFIESIDSDEEEETEESLLAADEITFGLERDLQGALRMNIQQLEDGLSITDNGKEKVTEAGRIDITAKDKNGNVVVVELKAGEAGQAVVAQILAYMGAIAESEKRSVRGFLVAGGFNKKVVLAARAVPNLELRRYAFKFTFESIQ
jgi:hypothetical protein